MQFTAEPAESALRQAIAGIENKDVFDRGDQDRLSRLKAEIAEIERGKPAGMFLEVITLRRQRDRSADYVLRELARLRFRREEGLPAAILEPDEFAMHRRLHGKSCQRLREARAKFAARRPVASVAPEPADARAELIAGYRALRAPLPRSREKEEV